MTASHSSGTLQTPLRRVRGKGSAKNGTAHWWMQRVTSIALIPLTVFFLYNLQSMIHPSYQTVAAFLAQPHVTVALILFIVCAYYHSYLGMQVVIEDYVHSHGAKSLLLMLNKFFFITLGTAAVYAALVVAMTFVAFATEHS